MPRDRNNPDLRSRLQGCIVGLAVGDALGVPVEFESRETVARHPVTDLRGHGTHNQLAGTWSDDTSLTLCLLDSLTTGLDYAKIAASFVAWYRKNLWSARGSVFDIGNATRRAIARIEKGDDPIYCGGTGEDANGNGALMRIAPLAFFCRKMDLDQRRQVIFNVSGITHGHPRSKFGCWLFVETIVDLISGSEKKKALESASGRIEKWLGQTDPNPEWKHYERCTPGIVDLPGKEIHSSGYVVHSLEASLWCFLRHDDFATGVLEAVNLGDDTDTTGAITGALAGAALGLEAIRHEWVRGIARSAEILELCEKFPLP